MSETTIVAEPEVRQTARVVSWQSGRELASFLPVPASAEDAWETAEDFSIPARALRFLSKAWVDKSVAAVVSVPAFWVAYNAYREGLMDLPRALFFLQAALFVFTMLIRRNPVRISANPWFWLVASINSYYNLLTAGLLRGGVHVAPPVLINGLAILGVWIAIIARLSLGRNIGLVPAQREIVTSGMYRYMRHPVYSAYFISAISWGLSCFSPANALVIGAGCVMYVVKTLMEESFLSQDPKYAAYMAKVRWRWFPGVI
ncbi:MAG TPA: methyltransferase [Terriglobales bacterium]|nr:methyltransferase [Terriglobales bacterium]